MTVVHCKRAPFDVYIGRPGKWGNPFRLTKRDERDPVLNLYRAWLFAPEQAALREAARRELRGKVLGCWCAPLACHGDVLELVANSADDADLLGADGR
ncbi:MAG TPA: DUF4326 domain-containing protein [Lacunisphaera sp.]|nr:DUF4326 domain-containing protein [Lacunisphaera sp.]